MEPSVKIYYKELRGYKYQTTQNTYFLTPLRPTQDIHTEYISLFRDGTLLVKSNYCWDGPSGPTVDGKTNLRASLGHDALYQLMRANLLSIAYKDIVDEFYIQVCAEDGMCAMRRWIDLQGLRLFGKNSCEPTLDKEVQEKILSAP